ncbi:type III-A CRISPR-associated protein Csm2 [Thermus oshimai]
MSAQAYQKALELVKRTSLTSSQFRNIYSELRAIYSNFKHGLASWEETRVRLELLIARLVYGTRKKGGIPPEVLDLFTSLLRPVVQGDNLEGPKALEKAVLHVESVLAFFYPLRDLRDEIDNHNRRHRDPAQKRNFEAEAEARLGRFVK